MSRVQNESRKGKANRRTNVCPKPDEAGKVQVVVTLTEAEYAEAMRLCDAYRLTVPELARSGIFQIMLGQAEDSSNVWMLDVLMESNEERETGENPRFQNYMSKRPAYPVW